MTRISVLGAGAWGTALALASLRAGRPVTLWDICDAEGNPFAPPHDNIKRATTFSHAGFEVTVKKEVAVEGANLLLFVPPAQHMRETCKQLKGLVSPDVPLILASKGIENGTTDLMSEVVRDIFPENPVLILSGPSFAHDVTEDLPTAVVLAAETLSLAQKIAPLFTSSHFQVVPSDDMIGTQLAGAIKNVVAIACGVVEGQNLGDNAHAAVLSRGLLEIAALGKAMGAKEETFLGLAGIGDITLTSYSNQSRNKSFGLALGQGTPLKELLAQPTLTEGVHTVSGALDLAQKHGVDMPLTLSILNLLQGKISLATFSSSLLPQGS